MARELDGALPLPGGCFFLVAAAATRSSSSCGSSKQEMPKHSIITAVCCVGRWCRGDGVGLPSQPAMEIGGWGLLSLRLRSRAGNAGCLAQHGCPRRLALPPSLWRPRLTWLLSVQNSEMTIELELDPYVRCARDRHGVPRRPTTAGRSAPRRTPTTKTGRFAADETPGVRRVSRGHDGECACRSPRPR